jgi:outer membrane protein assembly factor BamD
MPNLPTPTAWRPNLIPALILALALTACSGLETDPTQDWSAQRFYQEAKTALAAKDYATAIKHFETLEARYPYGPYADQAQLEIAYAYYKDNDLASAIAAANRFIRLHPTHPHVDYAYYLKGLAYFDDDRNWFERLFTGGDLSNRDPKGMRDAYDSFRELVDRFPDSRYAADSRRRMAYLVDYLARHEIHVARFYYSRRAYVATVNRAQYVIANYQRTPAVEDALGLQAMAYGKLGMDDLMQDSLRVLEKNFPESRYLADLRPRQAPESETP